ncbi:MAG TPA: nucleoside triphosphate pyrophosphatase [Candidatus Nanopelagicales bacterium]
MAEPAQGPGHGRASRPVLVLGSASPARATLLRNAGIAPVILASDIDEDALVAGWRVTDPALAEDPVRLPQALAHAKALDVAGKVRDGALGPAGGGSAGGGPAGGGRVLVVGADSMLDVEGAILGKARSAQEVRDRWATMAGRTGVLVTGHTVVDVADGRVVAATVTTQIRFGRPDPAELEAYIASGEPLAVAGSCTIDGLGGPFIDGIDGDHTNVIGLALPTLRALLAELGVRWTDCWELG